MVESSLSTATPSICQETFGPPKGNLTTLCFFLFRAWAAGCIAKLDQHIHPSIPQLGRGRDQPPTIKIGRGGPRQPAPSTKDRGAAGPRQRSPSNKDWKRLGHEGPAPSLQREAFLHCGVEDPSLSHALPAGLQTLPPQTGDIRHRWSP